MRVLLRRVVPVLPWWVLTVYTMVRILPTGMIKNVHYSAHITVPYRYTWEETLRLSDRYTFSP